MLRGMRPPPGVTGGATIPVQMTWNLYDATIGHDQWRNAITVGPALPRGLSIVQRAIRSLAFDEAHARAWLLHNVEEVGNLEHFLPALFHTES